MSDLLAAVRSLRSVLSERLARDEERALPVRSDDGTGRAVRTDGSGDPAERSRPGPDVEFDLDLVVSGLDTLDDVFYVYDATGRLVYWNDRLNAVFGATDADLAGREPTSFFVDEDREAVEAALAEMAATGETTVEARAETTDGLVWFELTAHQIEVDGETVGFSGIGRDITDRREREATLAAQNERLDAFADVVSHDLRNPLQVATGLLELEQSERERASEAAAEDGPGDEAADGVDRDSESDARLERVADALDRMARIVADVLVVAREGDGIEDPTPVSLATVARNTWETVDTRDATLVVHTDRVVAGDADRLDRLFANLYRNAVEHGGPDVTVTVADTDTGFAVADDGPGIPAAERERVFDPGVSGSSDGTGFGLDIVARVAAAHGWSVAAEAGADGGARFVFETDAQ